VFKSRATGSCLSLAGGQRLLGIPRVQLGACGAWDKTQGFIVRAGPSGGYQILDSDGRCLTTYSGMLLTGVVAMPCDGQPDKVWEVTSLSPGGKVRDGASEGAASGSGGGGQVRSQARVAWAGRGLAGPHPLAGWRVRWPAMVPACLALVATPLLGSPASVFLLQGPFILKAKISGMCMSSNAGNLVLSSACGLNNQAALFASAFV
jgi:hypothetical protein